MSNPSYYFNLFKKFQCLGHVAVGSTHSGAAPVQMVSFDDPAALYTASRQNVPLIGSGTSSSPLWMVLNAKVNGIASFTYGGLNWFAMPLGAPAAWADPAIGGNGLVTAFTDWLAAGKHQDIPTSMLSSLPNGGTVPGALAAGPSVFVCSSPSDDGTRPGTVPWNFWDSSL